MLRRSAKNMKNNPTLILSLAVFSISLIPSLAAKEFNSRNYKSVYFCHLINKRYAFAVSNELYEKMTKWNIKSEENPPTSPQKAIQLAKKRLEKINITEGASWTFVGAALQPVKRVHQDEKWIWKIIFQYRSEGFSSGTPLRMEFLVTMDGILVEPIITDIKR